MAIPIVDTSVLSLVYTVSASCGGYVSSDGSSSIIMVGVCISTNENPVVTDTSTKDASTIGLFYSSLISLNASTHYHVRAYAYNSQGTSYGIDVSFNTLPSADGSIYFVAVDGSDSWPGTIAQPWATWQKAFNSAMAGTTVYFRGGTWYPTTTITSNASIFTSHYTHGYIGTSDNIICYCNYPNEIPILDASNFSTSTSSRSALETLYLTYVKFKGLTIQNCEQTTYAQWVSGMSMTYSGVIWLENMVSRSHGGPGFWLSGYDTLYLTNCDSYDNQDTTSTGIPGGRADGFNITSGGTADSTYKKAYIYGCRSWRNSDDGFDLGTTKQFYISNCWAFQMGRDEDPSMLGDSNGFKFSYSHVPANQRLIHNCIAAYCFNKNTSLGNAFEEANFTTASYGPEHTYYNNFVYKCNIGFHSVYQEPICGVTPMSDIYRNNIVYEPYASLGGYELQAMFSACNYGYPTYVTQDHNTWIQHILHDTRPNPSFNVIIDSDFISLDVSQLSRPRKSDGSLPDVSFGHLSQDSSFIYVGTWVDLAYDGDNQQWHNPPSLGAFEYDGEDASIYSIPAVTTTAISDISTYTATSGGNVTFDGSTLLVYRGICISTNENPITKDVSFNDVSTGEGSYTLGLTGLSASTHYHVRAFAYNSQGTAYGADVSFNTLSSDVSTYSIPSVTTSFITDISTYSASAVGIVTHDGSISLTYRGFCVSTNITPTYLDVSVRSASTGEGTYTLSLTSLSSSTHYYVRAFAYNSQGTAYGTDVSFNTLSADASTSIPTVTTTSISNISYYTATGGGNVTHDGSLVATKRGICWSTAINPVVTDASSTDSSTGEGSYVSYLTSLSASTHYHVRAFAYNSEGTAYGTDVSFNTLSAPASGSSRGKNILVSGKFMVIGRRVVKY